MNPFERSAHLIEAHHYAVELIDTLNSIDAQELHTAEHGFGAQWPHTHPTKEGM